MYYFLKRVKQFFGLKRKPFTKRIINSKKTLTLSMIVHNEEHRFLKQVIQHAIKYVDNVVIVDDASTDNTVNLCKELLCNIPHKIIVNKKSLFHEEYKLRTLQWKETLKMKPDWILSLDADDIFEDLIIHKLDEMLSDPNVDIYNFRYFDMWNESQYREDKYWNSHFRYKPFLIRYQPHFKYSFLKLNHHCGRLPKDLHLLPNKNSDLRIKHMGWSREVDRRNKYLRYQKNDPNAVYGIKEQYESILDPFPNLNDF